MIHDLSPFLLRISGDFGIRWYGLSYMMGFVAAYYLFVWISRRQNAGLQKEMISDFVTYGAIGILIGGRLGYCVFYSPDLFLKFKAELPFWGVLAVNEGGMASHGGFIGLILACWLFARKHGLNQNYLFDLVSLAGPIGIFFGRVANYINGELVGRPCDPNFPLAVKFPQDLIFWPTQEASRLSELASVIEKIPGASKEQFLEVLEKSKFDAGSRDMIYGYIHQIIEAVQSKNMAVQEALAPLLVARHPSQLYAAAGEGLFLFFFLFLLWRKSRKPGVVFSSAVMVYALVRIVDEHFRTPDAHIGLQLFDLTRGQWLSIGMFVVGFIFYMMYSRRGGLAIPGWSRGQNVRIHRR